MRKKSLRRAPLITVEFTLGRILIAIFLGFSFTFFWLYYFDNTEEKTTLISFDIAHKDFSDAVNLAHLEWLRKAKPNYVTLYRDPTHLETGKTLAMNTHGYPKIVLAQANTINSATLMTNASLSANKNINKSANENADAKAIAIEKGSASDQSCVDLWHNLLDKPLTLINRPVQAKLQYSPTLSCLYRMHPNTMVYNETTGQVTYFMHEQR